MARRKTITREEILQAAFNLVATDGFRHFTARNVAQKVGSSTQPIYLEFKNMDDLKEAVYVKIYGYLKDEVFSAAHTKDPLVDMALNYIYFAKREPGLYHSLFLDSATDGKKISEYSLALFKNNITGNSEYDKLEKDQLASLHLGIWITATGIASLMASGILHPKDEEIISMMEAGIAGIKSLDHPIILNNS